MITPRLRRALHNALDLVLDALAEDAAEQGGAPKGKRRARIDPPMPEPVVDELTRRRAEEALRKRGFRKRD